MNEFNFFTGKTQNNPSALSFSDMLTKKELDRIQEEFHKEKIKYESEHHVYLCEERKKSLNW